MQKTKLILIMKQQRYGHFDDAHREYRVHRIFRGGSYDIHVSNPEGRQKGVREITVDGKRIDGNVIPATKGKHVVEVVM